MPSLSVEASRPKVKHSEESILFGWDFTPLLRNGETVASGTVECTAALDEDDEASDNYATSDVDIASAIPNDDPFDNDEGGTVDANCGLQARIEQGLDGGHYHLKATAETSDGNTRVITCTLQVKD